MPPLPEVLIGRPNPHLSRCAGCSPSLAASLDARTAGSQKRIPREKVDKLVARLSHRPKNAALEAYESNVAEVLAGCRPLSRMAEQQGPNSPAKSPSPSRPISPALQQRVDRLYTQAISAAEQKQSLLKRKFLGPLIHSAYSITGEQLTDFIQRNYTRPMSRNASDSRGGRRHPTPNAADATLTHPRKQPATRKDHVEHFYIADVEEMKRSRQQLLDKYVRPLSSSRPLTPAQVTASANRLSPPPSRQ